jgi:hypothetical protein
MRGFIWLRNDEAEDGTTLVSQSKLNDNQQIRIRFVGAEDPSFSSVERPSLPRRGSPEDIRRSQPLAFC